jgi:hypothetical protein
LTSWIEPRERVAVPADARELLDRSLAAAGAMLDRPLDAQISLAAGEARINVLDGRALEAAVTSVIHATAREVGDSPVALRASVGHGREPAVEVIVGPQARVEADRSSLSDRTLGPFSVARGGMGLSLALAIAVLEAHDAQVWCIGDARSLAAVRLPVVIEEST